MDDHEAACRYEELGHTAEIGVAVWAPTAPALFACAAQAMFSLLRAPAERAAAARVHTVQVDSVDVESLLVDWLSELLYLHEVTGEVYAGVRVQAWTPASLVAQVTGWPPVNPPALHIKAVTYHDLAVRQDDHGWNARIFFDI
jgi:SHS2 domain-containing protein